MSNYLDLTGPVPPSQPASVVPWKIIYTSNNQPVVVDSSDYEWLSKYSWFISLCPNSYVRTCVHGKSIKMHRMIAGVTDPKIKVDHKDRDVLNNRRENLRVGTQGQNTFNQGLRSNSSTGYKGVSFIKRLGKFCAYIDANKKRINIGCFLTAEEASKARDEYAKRLHGEFACLNSDLH